MLALGHAMAQAVGGRYGLPHGTLNGICLPAALRLQPAARARGAAPLRAKRSAETLRPASRMLAALGGTTTLREPPRSLKRNLPARFAVAA